MNSILSLVILFLIIFLIDRIFSWYKIRFEKVRTQLEVLKIVSKQECFGKFQDQAQFEKWAAKLLALKGFKILEVFQPSKDKDQGKDMVVRNEFGQTAYVVCKLADPVNWDTPVDLAAAQKLIGSMVAGGVKNGLIVTTASIEENVKDYLNQVNTAGYQVKYLDGDALVRELYDLREVKLPELLQNLGIHLRK